jgi:hypothetical protein
MTRPAHRTVSRNGFVHLEHDNVSSRCYITDTEILLRLAYDFTTNRTTRMWVLSVEKEFMKKTWTLNSASQHVRHNMCEVHTTFFKTCLFAIIHKEGVNLPLNRKKEQSNYYFYEVQGIHKRMVRYQKWIKNVFLNLHGHNIHHQRRQLSKFLIW